MAEDLMRGKKISSISQLRKLDKEVRMITEYLSFNFPSKYAGLLVDFEAGTVIPYYQEKKNE